MSTYIPTDWRNNQEPYINETNLNHLEAGVESAHVEIEEIVSGAVTVGHAATVDKATQTHVGGALIWVDTTDPLNPIGHIDAR